MFGAGGEFSLRVSFSSVFTCSSLSSRGGLVSFLFSKMTGLIGVGGEGGGLFNELASFNSKLVDVPLLRRTGLLCLKACAWGGYRFGRWRSARARRVDESCGAVR